MFILGVLLGLFLAFSFQAYKYGNGPIANLLTSFKQGFRDGLDSVRDRFK